MTKIQVSWPKIEADNRKVADLSPKILEECSSVYATELNMERFEVSFDDNRWILTFNGPDLQTMLISSRSIIKVLRYMAHPMAPYPRGFRRTFVGEDQAIAELNIMLAALDKTQDDLEQSESVNRENKNSAGKLARHLKKTRSHFMSATVRDVRRTLEVIAGAK